MNLPANTLNGFVIDTKSKTWNFVA